MADRATPAATPDPDGGEPEPGAELHATRRFGPDEVAGAGGSGPAEEAVPSPGPGEQRAVPGRPAVWSGRAEVPANAAPVRTPAPEWYEGDERVGRRWWLPILAGVVALLLLGVLAYGGWLIARSGDEDRPSAPATPARPETSSPSRETPTTGRTTRSAPARIIMPSLVGLSAITARRILDQLGIAHRMESRPSGRPPGQIIETDPPAGSPVSPGQRVTLVVVEPTSSPRAPTPTDEPSGQAPR